MSTETVSDPTTVEQNGHVASTPGMGGTSTAEDARADGAEPTEEGQEQEAEGAEPEAAERKGEEPAPREEEPAEVDPRVIEADAIARTILADPARLREYRKWLDADRGGGDAGDPLAGIDRDIEARFPRQEDRDAVRAFVGPLAQTVRDLREQVRTIRPLVEQSSRISARTEVSRSAEAHGVPADVLGTKEWRKFVAAEAKRDGDLGREMASKPARAGKHLAQAWLLQTGTRAQRTAENGRTHTLKNGRLHNGAAPSRGSAEKVHVSDPSKPGWDFEQLMARIEADNRGEKFKTSYAKPK